MSYVVKIETPDQNEAHTFGRWYDAELTLTSAMLEWAESDDESYNALSGAESDGHGSSVACIDSLLADNPPRKGEPWSVLVRSNWESVNPFAHFSIEPDRDSVMGRWVPLSDEEEREYLSGHASWPVTRETECGVERYVEENGISKERIA